MFVPDLDGIEIDICAKYMPNFNNGAFAQNGTRAEVYGAEGSAFVANWKGDPFDVVISDLLDPDSVALGSSSRGIKVEPGGGRRRADRVAYGRMPVFGPPSKNDASSKAQVPIVAMLYSRQFFVNVSRIMR